MADAARYVISAMLGVVVIAILFATTRRPR